MWGGGGGVTETVRSTQEVGREKVEKERQRCEKVRRLWRGKAERKRRQRCRDKYRQRK